MSQPEVERVVERIRKLLALSTSANPHEAALAAERAIALAQKHNLDLARVRATGEDAFVERSVDVGGAAHWRWLLMSLVAEASFCRALRRRERGRSLGAMFVIGEPHNIAVSEFLFRYLEREVNRLAEAGWRRASYVYGEHVQARTWKEDFRRGAVSTFGERLRERTRRFADESRETDALVLSKEAAVAAALERFHPRVGTTRVRSRHSAAYEQGLWAAREIELRDALRDRSATGQRMLE